MKTKAVLLFFSLCVLTNTQGQSVWNKTHLEAVKQSLAQPAYAAAYQALLSDAALALNQQPLSVMTKEKTPASGDKHDYMSQARYFWADPTKPDGLPYINRDGESNPELDKLDRNRLGELANSVIDLSLAWYFGGDEKYAQKATELLRVWFFDKDTRMNPNLNYAQMVPGHDGGKGRSSGLIDTYSFVEMLDAVQLLEQSKSFTESDSRQLKAWFGEFMDWFLNSKLGKEDGRSANNHSIAYDAQAIAFALYAGNADVAKRILTEFPEKRIFKQIEPDGKQPRELVRTLGYHYSWYNLNHIIDIAMMGENYGVNIANATSPDGRNLYTALDFLAAYLGKQVSAWHPYQQISGWEATQQAVTKDVYRAYLLNPSRKDYLQIYLKHRVLNPHERFNLLYIQPD